MKVNTTVTGGNRMTLRIAQTLHRLARNSGVYVGLPKGSGAYEDGTPIAVIGAVQEFGSADGRIPERSFLRVPMRSNQELFSNIMKELLPQVIEGKLTMRNMMEQVGARGAAVSQEAISAGIAPANAESTIRQKGSSTPLVDEGDLRRSITYVVEEGEQ